MKRTKTKIGRRRLPEHYVRLLLIKRGISLRNKFETVDVVTLLECLVCGHVWSTNVGNILYRKSGCPKCSAQRRSRLRRKPESQVRAFLASRNIELRSPYQGENAPLLLYCQVCHREWEGYLHVGIGCKRCASRRSGLAYLTPDDVIERALIQKNLELRSLYRGMQKKTRIRCRTCGYEWSPTIDSVLNNDVGCRLCRCNYGRAEEQVRKIFETVTGWKFPRSRPPWLISDLGKRLELDGYNARHALAFEFQGRHHYQPVWGEDQLRDVQKRDHRKQRLCRRYGVTLICVPFFPKSRRKELRACIKTEIAKWRQKGGVA